MKCMKKKKNEEHFTAFANALQKTGTDYSSYSSQCYSDSGIGCVEYGPYPVQVDLAKPVIVFLHGYTSSPSVWYWQ